ncbi:MAG: iron-containing alcohol dehydrogenase, partial [Treponema sp.]|nr:iron-containing alcohol dehydrogenase [Treponema sp.]
MFNFTFNSPTKLLFGTGSLSHLHEEDLPGKKALLLLSCGQSVHKNGSYDMTVSELKKAGVKLVEFAKIMENPLMEVCEEGGAFARENGCDFIVALGGGAVLDSSV